MLAKTSGMAAVTEVMARRPASSCEGLIVLAGSSIQREVLGSGSARRLKDAVRSGGVEPVVRRECVGVSTNAAMDYASRSRVPISYQKRVTGEEKLSRRVSEGASYA